MNMKKWLWTGACISLMSAMVACSSDDSSEEENNPVQGGDTPVLSSGATPASAGNDPSSSGSTPASAATPGSSSSKGSSIYSSSMSDTDAPQMACSEIMYNAPEGDGSALEWIEIYIAGGMDMDAMTNFEMHLSGAVDYVFPAEPLKKGEYIVVANDVNLFKTVYPQFAGRVFGPWTDPNTYKLVNEGDVVNVKIRGEGDVSCAFSNEPPWPSLANGKGSSLVYVGGNAAQSVAWCASKTAGGNPGVGGDACVEVSNTVRINEVSPNATGANAWLELYNSGDEAVDVTGWTVYVQRRGETLTIKSGSVPAKGFLVLNATENFDKELVVSDQGGEIYLYGAVPGQESSIWVSAGQYTTGVLDLADGSIAQGPMTTATPGAANSSFKIGSVYINEIHYHPAETNNAGLGFEFMEIVNNTAADLKLYNATIGRGWKIEGINMTFGSSDVIPANSMMVLLPDSMASQGAKVRSAFKIAETIPIAYYKGKLSNRSETIAIKEPYAIENPGTTNEKIFYTWHDATLYSDCWPTLKEADGFGYSLQRSDKTTMGYEENAWTAAAPTMGK